MTKIRAALTAGVPLRMMWDADQTTWDERGLQVLEAFQMYSDSLCSGCAQSNFHALDVANTREYQADSVVCLGCNVRETWHANHSDSKVKGEKVYVISRMGMGGGDDG